MFTGWNVSQGLFASVLLCALALGCSSKEESLARFEKVAPFQLTERSGAVADAQELEGKIWVAQFFFSSCAAECRQITGRMQTLQKGLAARDDVRLVSFSVDPVTDTPEYLRYYAGKFKADPERWWFVTGDKGALYDVIRESFLLPAAENEDERAALGAAYIHSEKLALVDKQGFVRAYFDGLDPKTPERVLEAIDRLDSEVLASN